jgi:hypothetical protein
VLMYKFMKKYNWFSYNDTGKLELPESALLYREQHKNDPDPKSHHH